MKHSGTVRLLAVAAILLLGVQASAQTSVRYRCRRPKTGSPAVAYRWYICWPDSNHYNLQVTTSDTYATVVHLRSGERVRVVAVDAASRAGPRSVASKLWSLIIPTDVPLADTPQLHPVHPNPFNSRATVVFDLPEEQRARVAIYSLSGRLVGTLVDGRLSAGRHDLTWNGVDSDGRAAASGVYVCRLETPGGAHSVRMTLVK
jgi:hypothetical protein